MLTHFHPGFMLWLATSYFWRNINKTLRQITSAHRLSVPEICFPWKKGIPEMLLNGSKTNAYKLLEVKAFLSFLELVGVGFAEMLSRPASKGNRSLGQTDDAHPPPLIPMEK